MSNAFTKITYNDSLGAAIVITDPTQFPNGSKTVSISAVPFTATITTEINNTSVATIDFKLVILVDGQVKKLVESTALSDQPRNGHCAYQALSAADRRELGLSLLNAIYSAEVTVKGAIARSSPETQ